MKSNINTRLGEISLTALIVLIVAMMIIPLSPWMMDFLISLNLGVSMLIFALALFLKNPLQFSSFPTVLLIATLYRLALNIASTRLILTQANAGHIIGGFGGFVVGGDIIVGAVIFGVILMVLFLVITRGAERVAEVAARFTLDALPGMQLAIETDLRSRNISPRELTVRREMLEQRSMYYGSLDGAMKFVRGDAVAALVITSINLVGGTLIGVLRKELSIGEALDLYGRLTVGDGLVSMIPALLISTAAGLLVTRVAQGSGKDVLSLQIKTELFGEPRALLAAAAMMILLAVAPGLPLLPFALTAMVLMGAAAFQMRREKSNGLSETSKIRPNSDGSISLDEMQSLLDETALAHPVLVREAIWNRVSLPFLADIVAELRKDGIGERFLPEILEALSREKVVEDLDDMLMRIRRRLMAVITASLQEKESPICVATLEADSEQMLQSSVVSTGSGKRLVLPPDLLADLVEQVRTLLNTHPQLVLLVASPLRRPLQLLLWESCLLIPVVAHGELTPSATATVLTELAV